MVNMSTLHDLYNVTTTSGHRQEQTAVDCVVVVYKTIVHKLHTSYVTIHTVLNIGKIALTWLI